MSARRRSASRGRSRIISSPENLAKLDRYRQITSASPIPTGSPMRQARALARGGKAFVDISGGLHASEIAGSQHTPQLAYELLSHAERARRSKAILDNVIFFLWPSINPDGQDIVVELVPRERRHAVRGVRPLNELYQKYIGHDNNRDTYMLNMHRVARHRSARGASGSRRSSTCNTSRRRSPRASGFRRSPIRSRLRAPPIMAREVNTIGIRIAQELDEHGQPGAAHMGTASTRGIPATSTTCRCFRTSRRSGPRPRSTSTPRRTTTRSTTSREHRELRPQSLYPARGAAAGGGCSDAVDYMVTASIATLDYAAKYREGALCATISGRSQRDR